MEIKEIEKELLRIQRMRDTPHSSVVIDHNFMALLIAIQIEILKRVDSRCVEGILKI